MPDSSPDAEVFVVRYDGAAAASAFRRTSRAALVTAVLTTVIAVIVVACAVAILTLVLSVATAALCLLAAVASTALAVRSWRSGVATRRMARDIQERREAMRISAAGFEFPDLQRGGWVRLPWPAIEAARVVLVGTSRVLVLELDPDFRFDDAGAQGLAKPGWWAGLQQRTSGMPGPRFGLGSLQRTIPEIDGALRLHSGGRVSLS